MSIFTYNGGNVIGMKGKDCVAIACDKRLGAQYATIDTNFNKIHEIDQNIYIGFSGLATDAITLANRLKFKKNMFELRENRKLSPAIFGNMVSNILYEKRFGPYFVNPIVVGIDGKTGETFLADYDSIGCFSVLDDFSVAGTGSDQLIGMCEALWEPNLNADQLFETISQALLNANDRDAASGWGAFVYVIEKDKVTVSELKARMD